MPARARRRRPSRSEGCSPTAEPACCVPAWRASPISSPSCRPSLQRRLRERLAVRLDLADRVDDVIELRRLREQQVLRDPDGGGADLPVATELLQAVAISLEARRAEQALIPARADRFVDQAVEV